MCTPKPLVWLRGAGVVFALTLASSAALAQSPNLGTPISEADVRAWDISIMPDGSGLPPGSGTPEQGARIFAENARCATARVPKADQRRARGRPPLTNGIDRRRRFELLALLRRCSTSRGEPCPGNSRAR